MSPVYTVLNPDPLVGSGVLAVCDSVEEAHAERVRLASVYRYRGLRIRKVFRPYVIDRDLF